MAGADEDADAPPAAAATGLLAREPVSSPPPSRRGSLLGREGASWGSDVDVLFVPKDGLEIVDDPVADLLSPAKNNPKVTQASKTFLQFLKTNINDQLILSSRTHKGSTTTVRSRFS